MSTTMVSTMPMAKQTTQFCTKPAMMKHTNEMAATVSAYGICVDTCSMWFTLAPADAMTVVVSPCTTIISGLLAER